VKVLTDIARYCLALPGIAPDEEKKTMTHIVVFIKFLFIVLSPCIVEYLLGIVIDIEGAKIDCLSLLMCPLLAQLKIGFISSFSDAAVYSTNEANKAGLKQSIILDVYGIQTHNKKCMTVVLLS
jgi:hypothetical protein